MADKRLKVAKGSLFGPAGNVGTDKRLKIAQANLHGSLDKRLLVARGRLVAPPLDARLLIAQARLIGQNSPSPSIYGGTPTGWVVLKGFYGGPTDWIPFVS